MQLSLLLEVRKLLKLLGVAYLEGRLKSRSYGKLIREKENIELHFGSLFLMQHTLYTV